MKATLHEGTPAPKEERPEAPDTITDEKGRRLKLRELDLLQEQDLIAAMGDEHGASKLAIGRAMLAAQVAEIDGTPMVVPSNYRQYRAMLSLVGKAGITAVMQVRFPAEEEGGEADRGALLKN